MIALIAAVPLESNQLRCALAPCEVRSCGRLDLFRGVLEGQQVGLLHCGVGKANAAAATAVLLETQHPSLVVNFGCAGAYPGRGLRVGDLALASEECFGDEGVATPTGFLDLEAIALPLLQRDGERFFNRIPVDTELLTHARACLDAEGSDRRPAPAGTFVTVSTCSGADPAAAALAARTGGLCETMEGAAIALVCHRYRVPFLELRGISNLTEDRDLSRWDLPGAAAVAQQAVRTLLRAWDFPKELA